MVISEAEFGDSVLLARRAADLAAPGPVLLRLAARGFGVTLPPGP